MAAAAVSTSALCHASIGAAITPLCRSRTKLVLNRLVYGLLPHAVAQPQTTSLTGPIDEKRK